MRSHTIPMRLLKEFAYLEPKTNSLRLWRYQRGMRASGTASPKSETRIDGYFAKPSDSTFEANIEKVLADQIENEVHDFLSDLNSRLFVFSDRHKRALTRYIALLFVRYPGRKLAMRAQMEETRRRVGAFIENEDAFLKYVVKVSIKEKKPLSPRRVQKGLSDSRCHDLKLKKRYRNYSLRCSTDGRNISTFTFTAANGTSSIPTQVNSSSETTRS